MKFERNDKYNTIAAYALIVIISSGIIVTLLFNLGAIWNAIMSLVGILKPLIYGFIMAFAFYPLLSLFEKRVFAFLTKRKPREKKPIKVPKFLQRFFGETVCVKEKKKINWCAVLSLVCTYLVVFAVIVVCMATIIPQVGQSYNDLIDKIPGYIDTAEGFIDKATEEIPVIDIFFRTSVMNTAEPIIFRNDDGSIPDPIVRFVEEGKTNMFYRYLHDNILPYSRSFDLADTLKDILVDSYEMLMGFAPTVVSSVAVVITEAMNIVVGLMISIYYLIARKSIAEKLRNLMSIFLPEKTNDRILRLSALINEKFIQFINGKLIDAVIIGLLCFILMSIFKMPYAPLISVLVGVTNVIPYVGPFLGAIPGAFIIFVSDPSMVIWFILLIVGIQQLDSWVIEPYVLHGRTSLPAVWIIISVIVMGGLFGIVGLLLGVPVFAVLHTLIKEHSERKLIKKGLPKSTAEWMSASQKANI